MRKIDTLFYFPKKAKPLQPIIEEFLKEEGKVKVSIMPGFVICPNLKQKFVPIEKKELFTCQAGDGFYFFIDGSLDRIPVSINGISIKKMPVPPEEEESAAGEVDPSYILLAEVIENEKGEISLSYKTNFNLYGQVYLNIEAYETQDFAGNKSVKAFTRLL
jgi:hypothetical protein